MVTSDKLAEALEAHEEAQGKDFEVRVVAKDGGEVIDDSELDNIVYASLTGEDEVTTAIYGNMSRVELCMMLSSIISSIGEFIGDRVGALEIAEAAIKAAADDMAKEVMGDLCDTLSDLFGVKPGDADGDKDGDGDTPSISVIAIPIGKM